MRMDVENIRLRAQQKTLIGELEHQVNMQEASGVDEVFLVRARKLVTRIKERHNGLEVDAD